MRKLFCNFCGEDCSPFDGRQLPQIREERKAFLEAHRKGFFDIDYSRAVINKNGEVTHFSRDYEFTMCPKCRARLENAVWKEAEKMAVEFQGRRNVITIVAPQFPKLPEQEPEPCCGDSGELWGG